MYVDTVKMLDTFSKDIIYKELPPPYTQTLFIELIRFSPGQPDTVSANGSSTSSGSSFAPTQPPPANGHTYHPRTLPPPPPPRAPIHPPPHRVNVPAALMPPPPPWEIKWTRPVPPPSSATLPPPSTSVTVNSTPASSSPSVRRLSVSSSSAVPVPVPVTAPSHPVAAVNEDIRLPTVTPLTPPSASRKRKYPEGDVATGRTSPYCSGSPSYKRRTPTPASAEPMDHHTPSQTPALASRPAPSSSSSSSSSSAHASASSSTAPGPASSGHRATQTLSPSLAMIMSPDTRHMPPFVVGTSSSASASLPATPPQQQRKVKLTYTNGEGTPR